MKPRRRSCIFAAFILAASILLTACCEGEAPILADEAEGQVATSVASTEIREESAAQSEASEDGEEDEAINVQETVAYDTPNPADYPYWMDTVKGSSETGYITTEVTCIETDHLIMLLDANVYVPTNVVELANIACEAIEVVTGLTFDGGEYSTCKITVEFKKEMLSSHGLSRAEMIAGDYAISDFASLGAGDLFAVNDNALLHELAHTLEREYDGYQSYGKTMVEGFASYVSFRARQYIAEKYPDMMVHFGSPEEELRQMQIEGGPQALSQKDLAYWMENDCEIALNGVYALGLRLMAYFEATTGRFTDWIIGGHEKYKNNKGIVDLSVAEQIDLMKEVYGADTMDGFYDWLLKNGQQYEKDFGGIYDLSRASQVLLLPTYHGLGNRTCLGSEDCPVNYKDLTVNLIPLKFYLGEYKQEDISNLTLLVDQTVRVTVIDESGQEIAIESDGSEISLNQIIAFRLEGCGSTHVEVLGYDHYTDEEGLYRPLEPKELAPADYKAFKLLLDRSQVGSVIYIKETCPVEEVISVWNGLTIHVGPGGKFILKDAVCIFLSGKLEAEGFDGVDFDGGWMWLEDGGELQLGDIDIRVSDNNEFKSDKPFSKAVEVEKEGDKIVLSRGFDCIVDITIPQGKQLDGYICLDEMNEGVVVRVNGVPVDIQFMEE